MSTSDPSHASESPSAVPDLSATSAAETFPPAEASSIPAKAKEHKIRVSQAVHDAAAKDGDEFLRFLRTASAVREPRLEAEQALLIARFDQLAERKDQLLSSQH
jgi:hypothetical protein